MKYELHLSLVTISSIASFYSGSISNVVISDEPICANGGIWEFNDVCSSLNDLLVCDPSLP